MHLLLVKRLLRLSTESPKVGGRLYGIRWLRFMLWGCG